jgi:hypothetical protein
MMKANLRSQEEESPYATWHLSPNPPKKTKIKNLLNNFPFPTIQLIKPGIQACVYMA